MCLSSWIPSQQVHLEMLCCSLGLYSTAYSADGSLFGCLSHHTDWVLPRVKGLMAFLPYRLFILSSIHSFVTRQLAGLGVFDLILQQCICLCMLLCYVTYVHVVRSGVQVCTSSVCATFPRPSCTPHHSHPVSCSSVH